MENKEPFSLSELKGASPKLKELCEKFKDEAEKACGRNFEVFYPIEYRELLLCGGQHYYIKVHVSESNDDYVHIHLGRALATPDTGPWEFSGIQSNKKLKDPIVEFN